MRVLITRPEPKASALARTLMARGHDGVVAPLLTIEPIATAHRALAGVQAIVLTSANAAPALATLLTGATEPVPVFAVGRATATAARAAGAANLHEAAGDGVQLARVIAANCRPAAGRLLHLCGADVRPGLPEALAASGFALEAVPVYRAVATAELPTAVVAAFARGQIDAVTLFSPRTARTFADLARHHRVTETLATCTAVCLSDAVADQCRTLPWQNVRVAAAPTTSALLDRLEARD